MIVSRYGPCHVCGAEEADRHGGILRGGCPDCLAPGYEVCDLCAPLGKGCGAVCDLRTDKLLIGEQALEALLALIPIPTTKESAQP